MVEELIQISVSPKIAELIAAATIPEQQAESLRAEAAAARGRLRDAYLEQRAKQFGQFDWRKAILGAPIRHEVPLIDVVYFIQPPSRARTAAIEWAVSKRNNTKGGVSRDEATVAMWLVAQRVNGQAVTEYPDAVEVLTQLGAWPEVTIRHVATAIQDLEAWINAQLDKHAGN